MKLSLVPAVAAASLCLSLPAAAQQQQPPAPFRLQTALDLPDWLKVSGSIRPRYESVANQFTAGRTGGDDMLSWQALLKAEANLSHDIFLGGELLDARRFSGDAGGSSAGEIDAIEPLQMYLSWRPKNLLLEGDTVELTAGRFTMDVSSRRLVSRSGMRNPLQTFDGVRAVWSHKSGVKATAFYTSPINRLPNTVAAALDNEVEFNEITDTAFYGWNFEAPIVFGMTADIYLYDLQENDAANQPTRNRDFSTAGVHIRRAPKVGTWDTDLEFAGQSGTARNTTSAADTIDRLHDATMLHAEIGYTADIPWSPRLSAHYDLVSGDDRPNDQSDERFDPIFGDRAFELGPTGIWGAVTRANLDSPGVRLEVKPTPRDEIMAMVRNVRLDSSRDSFGNSGVRDITGASGKDVGTHMELRWRRQVIPNSIRLTLGLAGLSQGEFLETAPNATDQGHPWYGYSELLFSF